MSNLPENDERRKEEILAKSRQSRKDEGLEHAKMRGFALGDRIATVAIGIPLALIAVWGGHGHHSAAWALLAYMAAFEFGGALTAYRFSKKKLYLVLTIGMAAGTVFAVARFLIKVLGWW